MVTLRVEGPADGRPSRIDASMIGRTAPRRLVTPRT
jgi:hypothetical protein